MPARTKWLKRVRAWRASGATAADYCARAGLNPRTLSWWAWKLRSEGAPTEALAPARPPGLATFVELAPVTVTGGTFELEVAEVTVRNARGGRLTRFGIEQRLRVLVARAVESDPSLAKVRVSPHTIRHTTAMHLLQSGIDLSVIAMWLGHESIQTTHQYLEADLEAKRRALAHLKPPRGHRSKAPDQQALRAFLTDL